jgi:MFS family permease
MQFHFLIKPTFLSLQASNILESLGFFLPSIYLTSYARYIGLSPIASTVILALLNSFSVIGAITLGHLCDRLHVTTVIGISTLGSTLAVTLLWGLSSNLPMLVLFAATYGIFAGGYSAIWTGMYKEVRKQSPEVGMGALMGAFSAGRGTCLHHLFLH